MTDMTEVPVDRLRALADEALATQAECDCILAPLSDTAPEGDTMTLADIAARCRSDALSLREAATYALREAATYALREAATYATVVGNGKIAQQATDRASTVDALATLLDRLARVPMANSYPPYVDAARRLARLAGVDL